ncbi:MAG: HAD family hydrolase [Lachnospiraceae bacterium]
MNDKKIILFDVDGVLIDSMPIWDNSANLYLKEIYQIDAPSYVDKNCESLSLLEAGEYIKSLYPQIKETPRELADGVALFIRNQYWQVDERPFMIETIKMLYEQGYQLYLATASELDNVKGALQNLGVWDFFLDIFTCTDIGYSKSYVAYFESVAKRLHVSCKDLILVEDSLHSIKTAKEAGLTVIGVFEEHAMDKQEEIKKSCDYYIQDLSEMKSLMEWK